MLKATALTLLVASVASARATPPTDGPIDGTHQIVPGVVDEDDLRTCISWAKRHNKHYSEAEVERRFRNILASRERIRRAQQHEGESPSATYSVDSFPYADLDATEQATAVDGGWQRPYEFHPDEMHSPHVHVYQDRPSTSMGDLALATGGLDVDWRKRGAVTPVEDQGPHGTCWAHGATVAIEGAWKIAGNPLMQVSVQQLVDGCNNFPGPSPYGMHNALCSAPDAPFIAQDKYPYVGDVDKSRCSVVDAPHDGACIQHTTCRPNSQCGTGQPCQADEEQLLQMLQDGPMAISVAHEGFAGYAGGVIKGNCACANCDNPHPSHAVALVGFASDDEEGNGPHWILKNSWGTGFGEGGYFRMQFGVNCLALASGGPCQADARVPPPAPPTPPPPPPTPTPPSFCSRFQRPGCRRHKKCHWVGMKCVAK